MFYHIIRAPLCSLVAGRSGMVTLLLLTLGALQLLAWFKIFSIDKKVFLTNYFKNGWCLALWHPHWWANLTEIRHAAPLCLPSHRLILAPKPRSCEISCKARYLIISSTEQNGQKVFKVKVVDTGSLSVQKFHHFWTLCTWVSTLYTITKLRKDN
jgi:hypothetical protein